MTGNSTFLETANMVVTWWIVAFLHSATSHHYPSYPTVLLQVTVLVDLQKCMDILVRI